MNKKSLARGRNLIFAATTAVIVTFVTFPAFSQTVQECTAKVEEADATCHAKNMNGEQQGLSDSVQSQGSQTGSIGNQSAFQCMNQKKIAQDKSKLLKSLSQSCDQAIMEATALCQKAQQHHQQQAQMYQAKKMFPQAQKEQQDAMKAQAEAARAQALQAVKGKLDQGASAEDGNAATNGSCQQQSANQPGGMPQPPEQQKESPSPSPSPSASPSPGLDCSNPGMAGSSYMCAKNGEPGKVEMGTTSAANSPSASSDFTNTAGNPSPSLPGGQPAAGSAAGAGGAGGGSGGFGGGGSGGGSGPRIDAKKAVQTGSTSSGMDGGGGGGGGGGGRGFSDSSGSFDPDEYGKKKRSKGVSGMSMQAVDGITGPMGESIFEKISRQYQVQKTNMIP